MTLLVMVNSPEGYVTKLLVTVNSSGLRDNDTRDRLRDNPTCYRELTFRVRDNATDFD